MQEENKLSLLNKNLVHYYGQVAPTLKQNRNTS